MTTLYVGLALVLLFSVIVGLLRIMWGPTAADRMMAAQLFGTCGVAILLLLSKGLGQLIVEDVALVFALLSALATVAFVRRTWTKEGPRQTKRLDHD
ncbi:MAG: multiple resistance and pH regulation protein F [Proteobacteria bacterium]|nr:multiple resistance and pH regulation protein F [Pseudomonadota bacterium]MBU1639643.1 multiple resistance and pH regulation protein F [Pseudomonadota bacterium]